MGLLLATIASGEVIDYGHITMPRMYEYARKVGADFHVITSNRMPICSGLPQITKENPSWWKLALIEWFGWQTTYTSLAFIDIDVFIPKSADDIFQSATTLKGDTRVWDAIYMCPDMNDARELPLWMQWVRDNYPKVILDQKPKNYLNAGIWVTDRTSALRIGKFLQENQLHSRWIEQDVLQLAAYQGGCASLLDPKFNQPIPFKSKDVSNKSGFWHLCGMPQNSKLEWLERMDKADRNGWTTI